MEVIRRLALIDDIKRLARKYTNLLKRSSDDKSIKRNVSFIINEISNLKYDNGEDIYPIDIKRIIRRMSQRYSLSSRRMPPSSSRRILPSYRCFLDNKKYLELVEYISKELLEKTKEG